MLDDLIFGHPPIIGAPMFVDNRGGYSDRAKTGGMGENALGTRIRKLREAKGLSQGELAEAIGIKQPSLSELERGLSRTLRGDTLAGLCRVLGVTPASLQDPSTPIESVSDESELVQVFRVLTPKDRDHVLAMAHAFRDRMRPAAKHPNRGVTEAGVSYFKPPNLPSAGDPPAASPPPDSGRRTGGADSAPAPKPSAKALRK